MNKGILNDHCRQIFKFSMNYLTSEIGDGDLGRSTIIFSPHPDDETLGCGGTIIRKKKSDAEVTIVMLTDGSRSHSTFISKKELKSIRARNAIAACHELGVDKSDVIFLEIEDGRLYENFYPAVQKIKEILIKIQPDEIFIPYYKEPIYWSSDHLATNEVVVAALELSGLNMLIYEYPIGFWAHLPCVSTFSQVLLRNLDDLKTYLFSGMNMLKDFRFFVQIKDVINIKQAALAKYSTQMTRLFSNKKWPILADVSNGEFLKCFFQDREFFRQYFYSKMSYKLNSKLN